MPIHLLSNACSIQLNGPLAILQNGHGKMAGRETFPEPLNKVCKVGLNMNVKQIHKATNANVVTASIAIDFEP